MKKLKQTIILDKTKWFEMPNLVIKGFCIGAANIVPGVSGGAIALILGIYERLIEAVKSFDSKALQAGYKFRCREALARVHWKFLIAILSGALAAVLFFTCVIDLPELTRTQPEPVHGLFFGLILGSIWFVLQDAGFERTRQLFWLVPGALAGWGITLLSMNVPQHPFFVFFSGMLAIITMILPGISGSFVLLILGQYEYILGQFPRLASELMNAVLILLPFVVGMAAGLALFARILSWLLRRWRVPAYLVLAGFMCGSLWIIWPWQNRTAAQTEQGLPGELLLPELGSGDFYWGAAMMTIGAGTVLLLEMLGRTRQISVQQMPKP